MKRLTSILLIVVLLFTSSFSFATIAEKLENHWANSAINRSFVAYYFSYLAQDDFARFEPNIAITELEFTISLASLFKDYGYEIPGIGAEHGLSRNRMVSILGQKLNEIGISDGGNLILPFKDVNTMSSDSIELLKVLFNHKIIVGESNSSFSPDRNLSQAEAIIILQRVREVLENMNTIAFNTMGIVQSYNSQEEIIIKEDNENIKVTITKQFPTPGYSMAIDRILREKSGYRIYFDISSPSPDTILPQVITYKTVTLNIDKLQLGGPPYNFILDGFNAINTNQ